MPVSCKEFVGIRTTIECGFTLKRVPDMIRTYSWQVVFKISLFRFHLFSALQYSIRLLWSIFTEANSLLILEVAFKTCIFLVQFYYFWKDVFYFIRIYFWICRPSSSMDRDEGGIFSKAPDWKPLFLIKLTYLLDGNFICKSMLMSSGCRNQFNYFRWLLKIIVWKGQSQFHWSNSLLLSFPCQLSDI